MPKPLNAVLAGIAEKRIPGAMLVGGSSEFLAEKAFRDLREAIAGGDDTAIIAEVERGEDHIKAKYGAALADPDLSPNSVALVQRCYQSVKEGHDQMRDLKHGVSVETNM